MGRTIPSFRNVLAMEKADWKSFRNALDKSEIKEFDDVFYNPRLYLSVCSNSVQLVPLQPIIMSILFHHYRELKECINQVGTWRLKSIIVVEEKGITKRRRKTTRGILVADNDS